MSTGLRRLAIYAMLLVIGVLLYVLKFVMAIQVFGLSSDTARWLAFGGLLVYSFVVAIIRGTRRR